MTRIDTGRRLSSIGSMALLLGTVGTVSWHLGVPSRSPGTTPALVLLETGPGEFDLDRERLVAEEVCESEWIESGNPESIPVLLRHLKNPDELVQLAALAEFAGMGTRARRAAPAIVEALQDPKGSIRVEAAVTLIHMNVQTRAAVRALAKELRSKGPVARARAASAIEKLVDPPPEVFGSSCWGPDPPSRIARPWLRKAVAEAGK
jgi:hypothetical protein